LHFDVPPHALYWHVWLQGDPLAGGPLDTQSLFDSLDTQSWFRKHDGVLSTPLQTTLRASP